MVVVIKFGGKDLENGEKIKNAVKLIVNSKFKEVVVVVSAIGKTTDAYEEIFEEINGSSEDYAEVISMGERTSARMFSMALKSIGKNSVFFEPNEKNWAIYTNENFRNAEINYKKTKKLVRKFISPLLKDTIPVVCGFLGKSNNGKITTLGRGGSDITALLLGNCLNAEEIILVKEVEGIFSIDPNLIKNAKHFKKLTIEEVFALTKGGAKIIRAEALKYKLPNQKLKVVSFNSKSLREEGTEIIGTFKEKNAEIEKHGNIFALTLIGNLKSENLESVFKILKGKETFGISTGKFSATIFIESKEIKKIIKAIHNLNCFKAISFKENIGLISITHYSFLEIPGGIAEITTILANHNINIIEITTSKATINVFIEEENLKDAFNLLKDELIVEELK